MKLRNKKTGEIIDLTEGHICETNCGSCLTLSPVAVMNKKYNYNSLAELNEEWEDYEEPKVYYYISDFGPVRECEIGKFPGDEEDRKAIGNYFETKEEAEKAVEKLKAWKRLRDKGFRFNSWDGTEIESNISYISEIYYEGCADDMYLLFGGEE